MSDLLSALGVTREELIEKAIVRIAEETLQIQVSDEFEQDCETEEEYEERYRSGDAQKQIGSRLKKMMTAYFDRAFERYATDNVLPVIQQTVADHVFQRTTSWGEKQGDPMTVTEYLEKKCRAYMEQEVDSSGKTEAEANRYGHDRFKKVGSRLQWMIGVEIDNTIRDHMKAMLADVNGNAISVVRDAVMARLDEVRQNLSVSVSVADPKKVCK